MLNLYQYHDKPQALVKYEQARTQVPQMAWEFARTDDQKRASEYLWAQDPKLAYLYANNVLHGPFPAGEPAIAQDPDWAYYYALFVLELHDEQAKTWGPEYLNKRHEQGPRPNA
jgi:hypothetical protein